MRQAIILAAGCGQRLRAVSNGTPKCLIKVGGCTLIEHHIRTLRKVGIERVCVVVGHAADQVVSAVGRLCHCVLNERYAQTNSLYSLWLARGHVEGQVLLMNGDVLAHPDVYHRVLAVEGNALAIDSSSGDESEHMKVRVENGIVRALGKELQASDCHGENVGILKFDEQGSVELFNEADRLIQAGNERTWAPAAVDQLARKCTIVAMDVADLPWTEIDFPEDLDHAERMVWPAVCRSRWRGRNGSTRGGRWQHPAEIVNQAAVGELPV